MKFSGRVKQQWRSVAQRNKILLGRIWSFNRIRKQYLLSQTHTLLLPFHHFLLLLSSRKIASFLTCFHVNTLPHGQCMERSSCKAPLMSEAALHDSGGEPGETSLFIWLHILAAARMRRGGERDEDRAWTERESERERERERVLWAQWPIYIADLYSAQDIVSHRTVRTCSSPHWPWIRSDRPPRARLGLGKTEEVFCMIWPFRWDYRLLEAKGTGQVTLSWNQSVIVSSFGFATGARLLICSCAGVCSTFFRIFSPGITENNSELMGEQS